MTHALSTEQIRQFHRDGYLGPFSLEIDETSLEALRSTMAAVLSTPAAHGGAPTHNRHLDSTAVWNLVKRPEVADRLASLLGPDVLLWRTHFFVKEPAQGEDTSRGKEVPWHQDANYWPLEPPVIASAWIAIDPSTRENGCLQLIPGSHRQVLPHVEASDEMLFKQMADPSRVDTSTAVDVEMQPGELLLFNERTLHHSEANRSSKRRIGLAVRAIPPMVEILDYDGEAHGAMQLCGRDPLGLNRMVPQPPQ